jgi:hypothetical protein
MNVVQIDKIIAYEYTVYNRTLVTNNSVTGRNIASSRLFTDSNCMKLSHHIYFDPEDGGGTHSRSFGNTARAHTA